MNRCLLILLCILPTLAHAWDTVDELSVPAARGMSKSERITFNQAVNAMVEGKSERARELFTPLADAGITDAQVTLGTLLARFPAEEDRKESLKWLYFAANAGVWHAQLSVADAYRQGRYAHKDLLTARMWLNRALPLGGAEVAKALESVDRELSAAAETALHNEQYKVAVTLLEPIAEGGDQKAQDLLARLYHNGHLGSGQEEKARYWYEKAAAQGSRRAQMALANLYLEKNEASSGDKSRAVNFLLQAASPGDAEAQYQLGKLYMTGNGVPKDPAKGIKFYRLAAEQEHKEAQYSLGVRYALGQGAEVDEHEAVRWFQRAAENGHAKAQHNLGLSYLHGIGVPPQPKLAAHWFKKAADAGVEKSEQLLKIALQADDQQQKAPETQVAHADQQAGLNGKPSEWVQPLHGSTWFSKLPKEGYTLQVISGRQKSGVMSFLDETGLSKGEYFHYIQHENSDSRHVVQWGYFKAYSEAKKAATKLSKGYTKFKPWIRKVDAVKKIARL